MEIYHHVWLKEHPNRSEEWLRDKLRDGFDIHHGDGDHTNNDPENLFLLESQDHMRLHGWTTVPRLLETSNEQKRLLVIEGVCRRAYELRVLGYLFSEIAYYLGLANDDPTAAVAQAKRYADHAGTEWPVSMDGIMRRPRSQYRKHVSEWSRIHPGDPFPTASVRISDDRGVVSGQRMFGRNAVEMEDPQNG